ncbi:MepB family protein [soil metagenome]
MLPHDLIISIEHLYIPSGLTLHDYTMQEESKGYNAASFKLCDHNILYRAAKITPTKSGQFVTIWKRNAGDPIAPFDIEDPTDFFIIGIKENDRMGQFIFPKHILHKHGYIIAHGVGGKRAMRVYPPWALNLNSQAQKTQKWQTPYFFEINQNDKQVIMRLSHLFGA